MVHAARSARASPDGLFHVTELPQALPGGVVERRGSRVAGRGRRAPERGRDARGAPRGRRCAVEPRVGEIDDRTVWLEASTYGPLDADVVTLASELRERGLMALRERGFLG